MTRPEYPNEEYELESQHVQTQTASYPQLPPPAYSKADPIRSASNTDRHSQNQRGGIPGWPLFQEISLVENDSSHWLPPYACSDGILNRPEIASRQLRRDDDRLPIPSLTHVPRRLSTSSADATSTFSSTNLEKEPGDGSQKRWRTRPSSTSEKKAIGYVISLFGFVLVVLIVVGLAALVSAPNTQNYQQQMGNGTTPAGTES